MQLLQLVKRLRKRTIYQLSNVFVYINKMITPTFFFFSLNAFISLFTLFVLQYTIHNTPGNPQEWAGCGRKARSLFPSSQLYRSLMSVACQPTNKQVTSSEYRCDHVLEIRSNADLNKQNKFQSSTLKLTKPEKMY